MRIILLLLLSFQTLALVPHTLKYSLALNGFNLADEVRTLSKNPQGYHYRARAQTTGIVKLFKDYKVYAETRFSINSSGVDSQHYQLLEQDGGITKKEFNLSIQSKQQKVVGKGKNWQTKPGNVVDSLSLFLALANDLKNSPEKNSFSYQVADGKTIKERHYERKGVEEIEISGTTIHTILLSDNKKLEVWFAPKYDYLPVLIKKMDGDKQYRYQLIDIQMRP